ncbi:Fasciclin-like arabinogalactan protein 11, partial [Linum grandiflorum]
QLIFTLLSLLFLCLNATVTIAQSPASSPATQSPPKPKSPTTVKPSTPPPAGEAPTAAMVPVSKGPLNIIKVLQKAGHFSHFIRLIKTTQEDIQFASQLNASQDGITIFAPTDGAFSAIINAGTLNALSDQQKIQLVQFHVIPRLLSTPQFQTISNPLRTLAGSVKLQFIRWTRFCSPRRFSHLSRWLQLRLRRSKPRKRARRARRLLRMLLMGSCTVLWIS